MAWIADAGILLPAPLPVHVIGYCPMAVLSPHGSLMPQVSICYICLANQLPPFSLCWIYVLPLP